VAQLRASATAYGLSAEPRSGVPMSSASAAMDQPSSPTEMPVPTDVPSPTSPVRAEEGTEESEMVSVPTIVPPHLRKGGDSRPVQEEMEAIGQLPPRPLSAIIGGSSAHSASAAGDAPSSPTEMPVPTDVPSPTSPVGPDEAQELPLRLVGMPELPVPLPVEVETVAPLTVASQDSSALASAAQLGPPSSPTEMPVPTDVPSPTSPVLPHEAAELDLAALGVPPLAPPSRSGVVPVYGTGSASPLSQVPAQMTPPSMSYRLLGQQPGTPTYSPTEDIRAPGTPTGSAQFLSRIGASSVSVISGGDGNRSPTYIVEEAAEEPLPPTPTYTGSSPTYLDELEPPTPTLEPDDGDLYGQDDEVVAAPIMRAATPGTPPGQFGGPAPGTPPCAFARLPGMESPTPTYDPDEDDDLYPGGGGEGPRPPFAAPPPLPRGAKRAHDGTEATGEGTPQSSSATLGSPQLASPLLGPALQGALGSPGFVSPQLFSPQFAPATQDPFFPGAGVLSPVLGGTGLISPGGAFSPVPVVPLSGAGTPPPLPPPPSSEAPRAGAKREAGAGEEALPPWKRRERRRKQ